MLEFATDVPLTRAARYGVGCSCSSSGRSPVRQTRRGGRCREFAGERQSWSSAGRLPAAGRQRVVWRRYHAGDLVRDCVQLCATTRSHSACSQLASAPAWSPSAVSYPGKPGATVEEQAVAAEIFHHDPRSERRFDPETDKRVLALSTSPPTALWSNSGHGGTAWPPVVTSGTDKPCSDCCCCPGSFSTGEQQRSLRCDCGARPRPGHAFTIMCLAGYAPL